MRVRAFLSAVFLVGCAAQTEAITTKLTVFETLRREEMIGVVTQRLVPLPDGTFVLGGSVDGPFLLDGEARTCGDGGSVFVSRVDAAGKSKFFGCTGAPASTPYLAATKDRIYLAARTRTGASFASARVPGPFVPPSTVDYDPGEIGLVALGLDGTPISRSVLAPGAAALEAFALTPAGDAAVILFDNSLRVLLGKPPQLSQVATREADWPPSSVRLVTSPAGGFFEASIEDRAVVLRKLDAKANTLWTRKRPVATAIHAAHPIHLELAAQASGGVLLGVTSRDVEHKPKKELRRSEVLRYDTNGTLLGTRVLGGREDSHVFGLAALDGDRFAVLLQMWSDGEPVTLDFGAGPITLSSDAAIVLGIDPEREAPLFTTMLVGRGPNDHALGHDLVASNGTLHVVGWLSGEIVGDQRYRTDTGGMSGFWLRIDREK